MLRTLQRAAALPLAGALLALALSPAAAAPPGGTWKVTFIDPDRHSKINTPWLVEIGAKEEKGEVLFKIKEATGDDAKPSVAGDKAKTTGKSLAWTVVLGKNKFPATLVVPDK